MTLKHIEAERVRQIGDLCARRFKGDGCGTGLDGLREMITGRKLMTVLWKRLKNTDQESLYKLRLSKPWNTGDGDIDCTLKIFVFQDNLGMTLKHIEAERVRQIGDLCARRFKGDGCGIGLKGLREMVTGRKLMTVLWKRLKNTDQESLYKLRLSKPWNTADGDIDCSLKIFVFQGNLGMTLKHIEAERGRQVGGLCARRFTGESCGIGLEGLREMMQEWTRWFTGDDAGKIEAERLRAKFKD